ncbi:MAG: TRAP transporter substrate-binding protein DctP [Polyangiaceae bacterium]|nr:TRAP transporter substrate-binding protein DctP [Polyangiaceae bacterium]MCW5788911.1 TRAP transporter substrate-binding protein DctP [Polyangiaceae bacterium]
MFASRLLAACFGLWLLLVVSPAEAATTLRVATLAPKGSAWGKYLSKLERQVARRTEGELELKIYYNGVQGDEAGMVSKLRSGQLDIAALTSVGLSRIHRDVMVLQLPGVLDSWPLLDKARRALASDLEAGFADAGFQVLGWGDLGRVRQMSKGFAVRKPTDLKGKRPAVWRNEPMAPVVYGLISGVTPTPVAPMEVLPALRAGNINVLSAPPLAAEQLQWAPQLDHIGADSTVCAIGASVMRKSALDGVGEDTRKTFMKLQARYGKQSAKQIRKLDDAAFARMKRKMTVVSLTEAERAEWEAVLREAVKRLSEGTFPKPLVERVVKLSGKK